MTNLNDLIGVKVTHEIEVENNGVIEYKSIPCRITSAHLDTYYFEEKQEQMYLCATLMPLDTTNLDDYDSEDFTNVSISYLFKYYN